MSIASKREASARRRSRIVDLAKANLVTAAQLAKELGCTERTIFRDVVEIRAAGVDLRGESGVGFRIIRKFNLGLEISKLIEMNFPGAMEGEPHAVAAVADGLGEAFAGVLAIVTIRHGLEAVSDVIDRNSRATTIDVEAMLKKALADYEGQPEGVKGNQ